MNSYIGVRNGACISFVGPDATEYVRAAILASALKLYADRGMLPTRNVSATGMLKMAKRYTGKDYKRGQYLIASADVKKWADEMKAALPTREEEFRGRSLD